MKCEDFRNHILNYAAGSEITADLQAEIDKHAAECGHCRRLLSLAKELLSEGCGCIRNWLVDYVMHKDKGDSPEPHDYDAVWMAMVEKHLAECEACTRELAEVRRVMRAFDDGADVTREAFTIIQRMSLQNASSVHIEVTEFGASVKLRKQGRLEPYDRTFDAATAELLIARLRRMLNVSLVEDGDGWNGFRWMNTQFTVRGSFFRTAWGQAAVLKLAEPPLVVAMKDTEASDTEIAAMEQIISGMPGLIVLCGIPDQVLRTARFAIGSYLSRDGERAVYDIEEFTPKQIQNIRSIKMSSDLAADIEKVLNFDPDIIAVGMVDDISSVARAIGFISEGHWVILQFPDDDINAVASKLLQGESTLKVARLLRAAIRLKPVPVLRGTPDAGRYIRSVTLFEIDTLTERRRELFSASDDGLASDGVHITLEQSANDRIARGLMRQAEVDLILRPSQCFTPEALACFERGRDIARSEGDGLYSTEHLLRAIAESDDLAVQDAFSALGIDIGVVRENLPQAINQPDQETIPSEPRLSPRLSDDLCFATMFSGTDKIAPKHLLQAMLYDRGEGLGYKILVHAGGIAPFDPGNP